MKSLRPITLSLSGLHSFREKQVVDFETLREVGVFGIFGPTGSGKSSILDAITLALYGKVERAMNNTQGIMNHAVDTLSVSFTFEIGQGDSLSRYRAERTYKRTDEISVRTSICRLIEVGQSETVLADREREVTAYVQKILGLTLDDFTRAVVLPQGNFAEFLSLRGSERRRMLERLFHLEKYGERLNRRLKEKRDQANAEVNEINAAQAEIGAASEKDVEAAKVKQQEANKELQQAAEQLKILEEKYETAKQLWNWQFEKHQIVTQKTELEKEQPHILQLKNSLEQAEEAARIKPYFDEWNKSVQAVSDEEQQYKQVKEKLEKVKSEAEEAKLKYERKQKEREKNVPTLIQQIERYKLAKQDEKDIDHAITNKKKFQQEHDNRKQELEIKREKLVRLKDKVTKAEEKQAKLSKEIEESTVTAETRKRVQQAVFEKDQLASLKQTKKDYEKDFQNKEKAYVETKNDYKKQLTTEERIKKRATQLYYESEKIYMQLANLHAVIKQHRKKVEREQITLQTTIENERLNELARELQAQLVDGEPCSVCGSLTHSTDRVEQQVQTESSHANRKQLERLTNIISEMNNYEITISHQLSDLQQLSQTVLEQLNDENINLEQVEQTNMTQLSIPEKTEWIEQEVRIIQQDRLQVEDRIKHQGQESQQSTNKLAILETQLASSKQLLTEAKKKKTDANTEYKKRRNEWKTTYSGKSLESIEEELTDIQKQDDRFANLTEQYNNMQKNIDKSNQAIDSETEAINELNVKVEVAAAELKSLNQDIKNKQIQLKSIVGEGSASELLQKTEQQLESLQREEKNALEQFEQYEQTLDELQNLATSHRERLSQLKERKTEATKRWKEELEQSNFEHVTELERALIEEQERHKLSEVITEFEQKWQAIHYDLERITELIGEKRISEEQWEETKKALTEVKQQQHNAFKMKSEANIEYKQIEEQYNRYKELLKKREKADQLVTQLTKLESVFRGNAFVEFMAEEQLMQVTKDASVRLGRLTNQRYAIEVNSEGGFVIRDDANGGVRRPVSTLSGGETFLTSLALALSLSSHIQLRGKYPLEFFFLDEGFGTLDQELLDTVITSLEKLHMENVAIGIISHVPELKERLARKLIVHAAEPAGIGTRITMSS